MRCMAASRSKLSSDYSPKFSTNYLDNCCIISIDSENLICGNHQHLITKVALFPFLRKKYMLQMLHLKLKGT